MKDLLGDRSSNASDTNGSAMNTLARPIQTDLLPHNSSPVSTINLAIGCATLVSGIPVGINVFGRDPDGYYATWIYEANDYLI